jgi:hypothetical protein
MWGRMKLSELLALIEDEKDAHFSVAVEGGACGEVIDANLRKLPDGTWLLTFETTR